MSKENSSISLLKPFTNFITERNLQTQTLGIASSGGIDSVVLSELCYQAGLSFFLAHCNFNLRGAESERDELFVRNLAAKYGVAILVKQFDTGAYAEEHKLSIQEAARNLRYQWFQQLHEEGKAAYILLAHHANDNIETLLMNFFRGTGLEGLTGMPVAVSHRYCLRPLLVFTRIQIETFAQENKLNWVEDSSNLSSKYTRNYFRNELLPALKKVYPQVEENLFNNINRFQKINNLYQYSVQELKKKICEGKLPEVRIPVRKLMQFQNTSLIYEIIKEYGFGEKQVEEVIKLTHSSSGKFIENETYQIIKHRNWLIISPVSVPAETLAINKDAQLVRFSHGCLEIKWLDSKKLQLNKAANIAQLNADEVRFPLLLRKWKQGDYFYPLGMRKKKKLSRFFIDARLPKHEKENIWVLESDNRIIWIVGHRIDDRFKITPATKNILQLELTVSAL